VRLRRFRPNHPEHVRELLAYLQLEIDPADYPRLLAGRDPDALTDDEYYDMLAAVESSEQQRPGSWSCEDPPYRVFESAFIPSWDVRAIHFTARDFSRFDRGPGYSDLHYTVQCGPFITQHESPLESVPLREVAWGFAFAASASEAVLSAGASKYGKDRDDSGHFVCFNTNECLQAYAKHDDEWQVIFVIGSEFDVVRGTFGWIGSRRWIELDDGRSFQNFRDAANAPAHGAKRAKT